MTMTLCVCIRAARFLLGMQYLLQTSIVTVQYTVLYIRFVISLFDCRMKFTEVRFKSTVMLRRYITVSFT